MLFWTIVTRWSAVLFRVGAEDFDVGDADVFAALEKLLAEADDEFTVWTPKTTTHFAVVAPTRSANGGGGGNGWG